MKIQMIALSKLAPSPANVRKAGASVGIDELATSIAVHGLLQNLQVWAGKKGSFEVVAGGRRLAALKFLPKLRSSQSVQCAGVSRCHRICSIAFGHRTTPGIVAR
jgi:ParB family chromosome partitioning protein